jgi:hypothetical protein
MPASYGRLREACQTERRRHLDRHAGGRGAPARAGRRAGAGAGRPPGARPGRADAAGDRRGAPPRPGHAFRRRLAPRGPLGAGDGPGSGRRWLRLSSPCANSSTATNPGVDAADWRAWAGGDENRDATLTVRWRWACGEPRRRPCATRRWPTDSGWFALAALDASVRLAQALVGAGGVRRGAEAARLVQPRCRRSVSGTPERHLHPGAVDLLVGAARRRQPDDPTLRLRRRGGAAARGRAGHARAGRADAADNQAGETLPPLRRTGRRAATNGPSPDGARCGACCARTARLAPLGAAGGHAGGHAALWLELLLFRGLFDVSAQLAGAGQQPGRDGRAAGFLACWCWLECRSLRESLRLGRHLETAAAPGLLQQAAALHDRYFQSRPISDMADRSHGLQVARGVPQLGCRLVQSLLELVLTVAGVAWLAPPVPAGRWRWPRLARGGAAAGPAAAGRTRPARAHPCRCAERVSTLDALLGLVPVRAHRAERPCAASTRLAGGVGPCTARLDRGLAGRRRRAGPAVHRPGRLAC